jgi:hypothetical protein
MAKRMLVLALILLAQGATASEGFVRTGQDGKVVLYTTEKDILGKSVALQFADGKVVRCCAAAVVDKELDFKEQEYVSDEFLMKDVHKYALKIPSPKPSWSPFIGIAVIGAMEPPRPNGAGLDAKEGGETSSIRTCLSSEGVHLIKRTKGRVKSHMYLGFGYDVEPTCSTKDLQ